jgi:hypothetical protein
VCARDASERARPYTPSEQPGGVRAEETLENPTEGTLEKPGGAPDIEGVREKQGVPPPPPPPRPPIASAPSPPNIEGVLVMGAAADEAAEAALARDGAREMGAPAMN